MTTPFDQEIAKQVAARGRIEDKIATIKEALKAEGFSEDEIYGIFYKGWAETKIGEFTVELAKEVRRHLLGICRNNDAGKI